MFSRPLFRTLIIASQGVTVKVEPARSQASVPPLELDDVFDGQPRPVYRRSCRRVPVRSEPLKDAALGLGGCRYRCRTALTATRPGRRRRYDRCRRARGAMPLPPG